MAPDTMRSSTEPLQPLVVQMTPALQAYLGSHDAKWWANFKAYCAAGVINPKYREPGGDWLNHLRHNIRVQTPARMLALKGVFGARVLPLASAHWVGHAHLVRFGQQHGHTCVPVYAQFEGYALGPFVLQVRRAATGSKKNLRYDPKETAFYTQGLRGWAWKVPNGHALSMRAFHEKLMQQPETAEHVWWYTWADAYLWRHSNIALGLLSPVDVATQIGEHVLEWLKPLLVNPASEMAQWPTEMARVRGRAIAMLELVPPFGAKAAWLPNESIGKALLGNACLLEQASYLQSRWQR